MNALEISSTDAAWIAGFFDGEGSVALRQVTKGKPMIRLHITQKDPAQLIWIQTLIQCGRLIKHDGRTAVTLKIHTGWRLSISKSEDCLKFIKIIIPYSRGKLEQLQLALELLSLIQTPGNKIPEEIRLRRVELGRKITELKHVG